MTDPARARTVAVVGAGISGLSAAHALQATHRVTLLEAEDRLGGHAHTHTVDLPGGGQVPVDSGFIVLNDRTYPELRRLFADLGVPTRPTEMSMSVTCAGCGLGLRRRPLGAAASSPRSAALRRPARSGGCCCRCAASRRRRWRCWSPTRT